MKREVLAMLAAVGMVSVVGAAQEPAKVEAATGGPKIQIDKLVYDFGPTSMVSKLEGVFVISNVGDAPLEKLKAQPACGCTVSQIKVDKLAPGEKTELPFSLNIGNQNRGRVEKHITITSNDPKQPSVSLALKAEIMLIYDYNPQAIDFRDLHAGMTTNVNIEIKRTDGKPHGLVKADGGSVAKADLAPVEGNASATTVRVTLTAEGTPRRFNDMVRVFIENASQPAFSIPYSGRIVGDLSLSQEVLFWGVADPETWPGARGEIATTRKVLVSTALPDQKLELTNLSSSIPELNVTLKPSADGKSAELVAVLSKLPKETTTGTVKFDTNVKSQPNVEIKVTINILKGVSSVKH